MVVYNAEDSIRKTLNSVKAQTYDDYELIVIDGGSTDSTLDIISDFDDIIEIVISENDEGIYDAMNKGVSLAKGVFTAFLNAGDRYYSENCLIEIFGQDNVSSYDVVYGSNYYLKNNKMIFQKPRPLSSFYKGMPFNHQSVFVKTHLVKKYPFKHQVYKIQCEYEFLLKLYLSGYSFYSTDIIVAVYEAGGYSDMNFLERTLERWIILKRAGISDAVIDKYYLSLVENDILGSAHPSLMEKIKYFKHNLANLARFRRKK
jgi:glycosyltransferase involved in cell wall biosynthesis